MKTILWALLSLAVMIADASADEARWTAGLRAELHPTVSGVAETSFYSYTVTGALTLKVGQAEQAMAVHCTGLDKSGSDGVEGTGACTWTDNEGGVIYAELKTNGPWHCHLRISCLTYKRYITRLCLFLARC